MVQKVAGQWLFLSIALLLGGCRAAEQKPPALAIPLVDTITAAGQQTQADTNRQKNIKFYLYSAQQALDNGRLMRPKKDNAYDWYNQVLWLQSDNADAHSGMREIGQSYLRMAEQAFRADNHSRAQLLLARALWVSASPAEVAELKKRFPAQLPAANEFRLQQSDLNQKNTALIARLNELAQQAKGLPSRLLIIARNDAEGRWIYKQMREAVLGYRLRGNIEVGSVPKVVLIDMPAGRTEDLNDES